MNEYCVKRYTTAQATLNEKTERGKKKQKEIRGLGEKV